MINFSNVHPNTIYSTYVFKALKYTMFPVQALVHVSKELSLGNFDSLEELFTKPTLEEIRRNFALLNLKQRLDLAVAEDDIFLSFPYQIGIIFTNEGRLCHYVKIFSIRYSNIRIYLIGNEFLWQLLSTESVIRYVRSVRCIYCYQDVVSRAEYAIIDVTYEYLYLDVLNREQE